LNLQVTVSKEAAQELRSAALWYEKEQQGLGARLISAFEKAVQLLREPTPPLVNTVGQAAVLGAKRLLLHGFPFSLVFIQHGDSIVIVAFAHFKRLPDYWLGRIAP